MNESFEDLISMLEKKEDTLKQESFSVNQASFYKGIIEEYVKTGFTKEGAERREKIQGAVEGWLKGLGMYTSKLFDRADIDLMEKYMNQNWDGANE